MNKQTRTRTRSNSESYPCDNCGRVRNKKRCIVCEFDKQTAPITDQEKELLPKIEAGLNRHIGKDNAISAAAMRAGIKKQLGKAIGGPRMRKLLHHIRTRDGGPLICASSKGYYVAKTKKEYQEYMKSLNERLSAIKHLRDCMEANAKAKEIAKAQEQDPFESINHNTK